MVSTPPGKRDAHDRQDNTNIQAMVERRISRMDEDEDHAAAGREEGAQGAVRCCCDQIGCWINSAQAASERNDVHADAGVS